MLDCKGGRDARRKADRTRRLLYGAGARHVAIWPDEARVSVWDLPAPDLAVLLYQMIETGTGNAAYYADILHAVTVLAVTAPGGPPRSAAAFLERLDPRWLAAAWDDGTHPAEAARVRAAARHIGRHPAPLRHAAGPARPRLRRPRHPRRRRRLVLHPGRHPRTLRRRSPGPGASPNWPPAPPPARTARSRAILLAADDYSAVSRRVPLSNLYERGRSLGIGVQVSAQTWQGLGADDDERYRIAATADGGLWVMHTPYPEPLCELAGTRRVLETAHKLIGNAWGDEGTTRLQHAWTADPDLIRRLRTGQACYITHGTATYVQVARPAPLPAHPPARTRPRPARCPAARRPARHPHRRQPSRPPVSMTIFGPGAAP